MSLVENEPHIGLTTIGCRSRRQRLVSELQCAGLEAMLVTDRRHIHYFTGHWISSHQAPLLIVDASSASQLVIAEQPEQPIDPELKILLYDSRRLGTLVSDQFAASFSAAEAEIARFNCCGIDVPNLVPRKFKKMIDLSGAMGTLRRSKDEDEVAIVRVAIRACEAAYAHAAEIIQPGLREIDLFAEMQSVAVRTVGEPIGELGNDFRSGAMGGPPRSRRMAAGELLPLDMSIVIRGYCCDLCRTFAVGGRASDDQRLAAEKVQSAMDQAKRQIQVGCDARQLYEDVKRELDGFKGWKFPHHLGHGIGLNAHESPRINPNWSDRFQTGDLFTLEPGLYGDELRAGVRIEENFWLSPNGLVQLSNYPTVLN
jgi:Xaa-Pro dipeptidase